MNHPSVRQTELLSRFFHCHQKSKGGEPYWLHPRRVMFRIDAYSDDMKHAALLHDVVEDCGVTVGLLLELGYSFRVVSLVDGMTRSKQDTYREYINRIINSGDKELMLVKLADCLDNASPSRLAGLPEHERGLEKRYRETIQKIEAIVGTDHRVLSGDLKLSSFILRHGTF